MAFVVEEKKVVKGFVSCLMVTKPDRESLATEAARSFQEQLYGHRFLEVVTDFCGYTPSFPFFSLSSVEKVSLGELRTFLLNSSDGEYVAQWDDDDLYHSFRLSEQIAFLQSYRADLCFLRRVTLRCICGVEAISHERIGDRKGYWECTMTARREKLVGLSYPILSKSEDTVFVERALENGLSVAVLDQPDLYTCRYHGGNTWDAEHFDQLFRRSSRPDHKPSQCKKAKP